MPDVGEPGQELSNGKPHHGGAAPREEAEHLPVPPLSGCDLGPWPVLSKTFGWQAVLWKMASVLFITAPGRSSL